MENEVIKVHISEIKSNPDNPRFIKDEKYKKLVQSLKDFPEMVRVRPIVVNSDMVILGGNMRHRAMIEAGWNEVPVIKVNWTEEKQREFIIKDNASFGEWDYEMLANQYESSELEEWGIELPEFDEDRKDIEEDEAPEVSQDPPVSKLGEVYQLGRHRLMCGDSTKIEDVEKLMNGKKADMVFTDPPYNTGMVENNGSTWLNHMFNDKFSDSDWQDFINMFTSNYATIMKDNSVAYICLDWRRNYELIPYIKKYFHLSNIIVWDKVVHGLGSDYKYTYELINVCKKGKPILKTHQGEDSEYSDVWHIQRKMGKDNDHATKKPIELCTRCIRHGSNRDNLIVDLFGGSGSTLIACEQTNRTCYMMELDPKYCDVIRKRYAKFIGKEEEWIDITPVIDTGSQQGV